MTVSEAIKELHKIRPRGGIIPQKRADALEMAIQALEEVQKYRAIGTVEELQKAEKEEDILKFYYCDSEDSYLVGLRIGNFYYAHYIDGRWVFDMSRHLPWGEHVVDDTSAWKEHTYPSEPKEINFSEWLNGFIKKECGGTSDECRAAVEKQKEIKNNVVDDFVERAMKQFTDFDLKHGYPTVTDCKVILRDIAEQMKGSADNEQID